MNFSVFISTEAHPLTESAADEIGNEILTLLLDMGYDQCCVGHKKEDNGS